MGFCLSGLRTSLCRYLEGGECPVRTSFASFSHTRSLFLPTPLIVNIIHLS